MRVLLAHNHYRSAAPSGEDSVFQNEKTLLEQNGIEVVVFERFNDEIAASSLSQRLRLAHATAWSRDSHDSLDRLIRQTRPDIAHFHNTFPLITPSAYAACRSNGVPVVQTLHNYRLICPAALLFRDGHVCQECVGRNLLPALVHRCYRKSLASTAAIVWLLAYNRRKGTYRELVNRYIAPTNFVARQMAAGGIPGDRIEVKPHFLPQPGPAGTGDGGYAVYVGRLGAEKGVHTLLAAWRHLRHLPLKIIGDGELRVELETIARQEALPVEFLGMLAHDRVMEQLRHAELLVLPSECHEVFGLAVIEAYACGTPVVASRTGGLAEIVNPGISGYTFNPGDPDDLAEKVMDLTRDPLRKKAFRGQARMEFEKKFDAGSNFDMLLHIYEDVIRDSRQCN
jgi:glycosyltransferase involved in cell wall biosynthesis